MSIHSVARAPDPRYNCSQASDCATAQTYCQGFYLACANKSAVFKAGETCTVRTTAYLRAPPSGCGCENGRCTTWTLFLGGGRGLTRERALDSAEDDARNSASSEGNYDCVVTDNVEVWAPSIDQFWRANVEIKCTMVY
jgi:hypothetical protein